jgi:hypothetical protein
MRTVLLRVILAVIASAHRRLLQQSVCLFTQPAPATGLEGIAPADTDGTDVQRITISPTSGHQPG